MKTHLTKALILVSIAAGFAAAGCELIVDFDRTKIPVEAVDAGALDAALLDGATVTDGAVIGEGGIAPSQDGGGGDAGDADVADAADQ